MSDISETKGAFGLDAAPATILNMQTDWLQSGCAMDSMTSPPIIRPEKVLIRLASSADEIRAAQRLRYKVFYEECAAIPSPEAARERRDFDPFDDVADHLIVVDESIADPQEHIVGTYRLLRREVAERHGKFYTSSEYDITPILNSGRTLLELGRSCVLAPYRTRPIMQLLWQGITSYMVDHNIELMFGCASFPGTDPETLRPHLAYLYHYHLSPPDLRPRALEGLHVEMNTMPKDAIDARAVFSDLPALIKGYLRLGAGIGDGAVIDRQFNTVDVCVVLEMTKVADRYYRYYGRKIGNEEMGNKGRRDNLG